MAAENTRNAETAVVVSTKKEFCEDSKVEVEKSNMPQLQPTICMNHPHQIESKQNNETTATEQPFPCEQMAEEKQTQSVASRSCIGATMVNAETVKTQETGQEEKEEEKDECKNSENENSDDETNEILTDDEEMTCD